MHSVRSNNLSLKYQSFAPEGCKNIRIGKFAFVTITQFLSKNSKYDEERVYSLQVFSLGKLLMSKIFQILKEFCPDEIARKSTETIVDIFKKYFIKNRKKFL